MTNKRNKAIRYLFMICIYNLTMALIVYFTQEISTFYNFRFEQWSWITWWCFLAILVFIGGLFAYMTAFFVEVLDELMNRFIVWVMVRYSENVNKLERKLNELKRDN